jgi:hypothetical protein
VAVCHGGGERYSNQKLGPFAASAQTRPSKRRNKSLPGQLFQVLQRAETAFRLKKLVVDHYEGIPVTLWAPIAVMQYVR